MNKAILIGNLTKDVELRNTSSGKTVGSVTIATNEQTTDQAGNKNKVATFHNLVIWNKAAEIIAQYCKKGSKLYIEGKIINRSYDAPDGTKRYVSEVLVKEFEFLDGTKSAGNAAPRQEEPQEPEEEEIRVDNIPF